MKGFYIRWAGTIVVALVILALGVQRYYREVYCLTPEQLLAAPPATDVRVIGLVQAGSLTTGDHQATFDLVGTAQNIGVNYQGDLPDGLRELKLLVVIGRWQPENRQFSAHGSDLVPNYGFITAAYILGIVPMMLFLFVMERRVKLLYNDIKQSKAYQSEMDRLE